MEKERIDYELAEERPTDDHGSNGGNSDADTTNNGCVIELMFVIVAVLGTAISLFI